MIPGKIYGPAAPLTSATIAAAGTDYSNTFQPNGGGQISCSVQATGGTSGTVTCTFQISNDGTNWTDHDMTGTFTFTGGATTQTVSRTLLTTGGGKAATAYPGVPAPFIRLKIANGASASITAVSVCFMQA